MKNYETVVGLEVHVELKTKTKIFCSCKTDFGGEPNTQCCPVCLGYPGTLPVLNRRVLEYAVKAGLATNCEIAEVCRTDRKNYIYPDLPKAYQISQYDRPLCAHGFLDIDTGSGTKRIGITRIHIEEDAGKLIHRDGVGTLIDGNRCGVPLIEIVSEPDIRTSEEAVAYLKKLRTLMLYIGISDCKMQEGSMRCDVNLSVRRVGDTAFGTRTEIKNINSFAFVAKAIDFEAKRQIALLERGERILPETRRFNMENGRTESMRRKEEADDYRFFPEPDLPPIVTESALVGRLADELPELPDSRKKRYVGEYGLSAYESEQLVAKKEFADYFEAAALLTAFRKELSTLLLAEGLSLVEGEKLPPDPRNLAALASLLGREEINASTAKKLLSEMKTSDFDPVEAVRTQGLSQLNDREEIEKLLLAAIEENPRGLADCLAGKRYAAKAYVGAVMKKTNGRANPTVTNQILEKIIEVKTNEQ